MAGNSSLRKEYKRYYEKNIDYRGRLSKKNK